MSDEDISNTPFEVGAERFVGNQKIIDKTINKELGQSTVIALAVAGVLYSIAHDQGWDQAIAEKTADTYGATTRSIESVFPDEKPDHTLPKGILTKSVTVMPNDHHVYDKLSNNAEAISWEGLKVVTQEFDPQTRSVKEVLVDPTNGFELNNGMLAYLPEDSSTPESNSKKFLKLLTQDPEGNKKYVYLDGFNPSPEDELEIKVGKIDGGGFVMVPQEQGIDMPAIHELNIATQLPTVTNQ